MYNQKKKENRVSHKRPRIWGFSTGGHMWSVADSCQCFAKATTILQSSYPPIKINQLTKKNFFAIFIF